MPWINVARVSAILFVVLLHVSAGLVLGNPLGSESWWIGNIYDSSARWCVPVFVAISGALLLDPAKEKESVVEFYKKRLTRILVPTVFWSIFFLVWSASKTTFSGGVPDFSFLIKQAILGKPYFHLWFLYMIIGLYVFTPFLRIIVRNGERRDIRFLLIVLFCYAAINSVATSLGLVESRLFINWFLSYLPYFLLGYFVRFSEYRPHGGYLFLAISSSLLVTALGFYYATRLTSIHRGLYFYDYLSLTVIPMSVAMVYAFKHWTAGKFLITLANFVAPFTLGIYLMHPIFLECLEYVNLPYMFGTPLVGVPVTTTLIFGLSLASTWVLSRIRHLERII